jgi:plasmid maintenance system antidote protein VapI
MPRTAIDPGAELADAIAALGITATQLAGDLRVPPSQIAAILKG